MGEQLKYAVKCDGRTIALFEHKTDAEYFLSDSQERFPDCKFKLIEK